MSEKKVLTEEEKKDKEIFYARAVGWVIFAWIIPCAFLIWRYNLFQKVSSVNLSGGAMLLLIFTFVFLIVFIAKLIKGKKWSYYKQILKGVLFVILPLGCVLCILYVVRNHIDYLMQFLGCTILSEVVAIVIDPFPQWTYEQSKGEEESLINYVLDKRDKKNDNK